MTRNNYACVDTNIVNTNAHANALDDTDVESAESLPDADNSDDIIDRLTD